MEGVFRLQKDFDARHGWDWSAPMKDSERTEKLKYGVIALAGEVGELANELKKALREAEASGRPIQKETYARLGEEVTDVFIYVVKLAMLLGIDLKRAHADKVKRNEERFRKFEKAK